MGDCTGSLILWFMVIGFSFGFQALTLLIMGILSIGKGIRDDGSKGDSGDRYTKEVSVSLLLVMLTVGVFYSSRSQLWVMISAFVLQVVIATMLYQAIRSDSKSKVSKTDGILLSVLGVTSIFLIYTGLLLTGILPSFDGCSGSMLDYGAPLLLSLGVVWLIFSSR